VRSVLETLSEGFLFWLSSSLSTADARVYLQTCGFKSEGYFDWEGFGFSFVFCFSNP
jgi:hypothetical protein